MVKFGVKDIDRIWSGARPLGRMVILYKTVVDVFGLLAFFVWPERAA
jgi:hypothetical protein